MKFAWHLRGRLTPSPASSSDNQPVTNGLSGKEQSGAGVLADLAEMAQAAAEDGQPLSMVFEDLRLALELGDDDEIPEVMAKTVAMRWAETHHDMEPVASTPGPSPEQHASIEDHLFRLAAEGQPLPTRLVVVRLQRPQRTADSTSLDQDILNLVVRTPAEFVPVACTILGGIVNLPGEVVAPEFLPRSQQLVAAALMGDVEHGERSALIHATLAAYLPRSLVITTSFHDLEPGDELITALRTELQNLDTLT